MTTAKIGRRTKDNFYKRKESNKPEKSAQLQQSGKHKFKSTICRKNTSLPEWQKGKG